MSAISLCMIVRDEERFLPSCLESVRGVVDEIIVVDTGSRDSTVPIAERFGANRYEQKRQLPCALSTTTMSPTQVALSPSGRPKSC